MSTTKMKMKMREMMIKLKMREMLSYKPAIHLVTTTTFTMLKMSR